MICTEYRKQLHELLDKKSDEPLPTIMDAHIKSCQRCSDYTTFMLSLHRELFRVPAIKPSVDFIEQLKSLEIPREPIPLTYSWKPDVRRAAVFMSFAVLLLISQLLPTNLKIFIDLPILTIGLALWISTMLKPFFFTKSGNATAR